MEVSRELKEELRSLISKRRSKHRIKEVIVLCDTCESALIFGEAYDRKGVNYYHFYAEEKIKLVFIIDKYDSVSGYMWNAERAKTFRDNEVIVLSTLLSKCPSYNSQDG